MGLDPPIAEVQTSTECKFNAFTLQATMAGLNVSLKTYTLFLHLCNKLVDPVFLCLPFVIKLF